MGEEVGEGSAEGYEEINEVVVIDGDGDVDVDC